MLKYVDGNLITLALEGKFDVIAHGCNCFCRMGAGIAPQMAKAFGCDKFDLEAKHLSGDMNKLGQIDYREVFIYENNLVFHYPEYSRDDSYNSLFVINAYTQYRHLNRGDSSNKAPIDYEALTLCMRKIKDKFSGVRIGLPKIGAGLAGGNWELISGIIDKELQGEDVTIVNFIP